ncbi:site-specific integrase [Candidatus Collierbacteria bacterium]|nr:site-specific integrase [Candidatus Collierbacteria bacterium]
MLIKRYLNSLRQSGKSILTLSAYATDLKQFSTVISPTPLTLLTNLKLTTNNQQLISRFSPNSRVRKLTTIREFLKWCFIKGYLKKDLSGIIKPVRRITISPAKSLSTSQFYRLRSKADVKERLLLELIININLKLSAIVKLKMKDITPLFLRSCGAGSRFVGQSLDYYLAQFPRGPKSYLLANKFNRPMSVRTLSSILKNLSRRAGVKHGTFRNLRAIYFASQERTRSYKR